MVCCASSYSCLAFSAASCAPDWPWAPSSWAPAFSSVLSLIPTTYPESGASNEGSAGGDARDVGVDRRRLARHVDPVEAQHMLRGFGDEPVAQRIVGEQPLDHRLEVLGVAAVEAQPDALVRRHDLAQPARVGDDARAARGHRLEGDEAERLVQ